jgi:hypothetical protein
LVGIGGAPHGWTAMFANQWQTKSKVIYGVRTIMKFSSVPAHHQSQMTY